MNILKSEFYKLKKSKPFWICLVITVILAAVIPFAFQQAVVSRGSEVQNISLSAVDILCYSFGLPILSLIAGIFTSIFVSSEFHHGTMKNYISKGYNREKIFLSKFLICAFAVTIFIIVYIPIALISGTIFLGFYPHNVFNISTFLSMLAVSWILIMAYVAVFVAIGMSLRSNGASIATNMFLVSEVPMLISALDFAFNSFGIKISKFWIDSNLSAVATMTPKAGALTTGTIIGIVWLVIAIIGGMRLFRCQDIK